MYEFRSYQTKLSQFLLICDNCFNSNEFDRYEEYFDYMFPEEAQTTNLKILEAAYKWKKQKASADDD